MLLLACVLCAGMVKAQVAGTPYIAGCPAPDAPGEMTFSPLTALNNTGSVWVDACTAAKLGLGTLFGRIYGTTTVPATYADFKPTTMLFLPAAGYRFGNTGALMTNVYYVGYYWSSEAYLPMFAYFLLSDNGSNQVTNMGKTHGMSVRCVQ